MDKQLKYLLYAALAVMTLSCAPGEEAVEDPEDTVSVTLHVAAGESFASKSSFTWGEDEIRDIEVVVTDAGGAVCDVLYAAPPGALHFTGIAGQRYRLWAAANLGGKVEVEDISDFLSSSRSISAGAIAASGIPMYNGPEGQEIRLDDNMGDVTVTLTRMLARVDLKVETRMLDTPRWFNVRSVRIRNAINSYLPFSPSVSQEHSGRIDYAFDDASARDISTLNRGGTISLYAFENMQGELLRGNTDPWKKVPSYIGDAEKYCTYLEVYCTYGFADNDVTFRMYLGKDATSNFDVERNTVYRITLMPTESEIRGNRGSWKVDAVPWIEVSDMEFVIEPSPVVLEEGGEEAELHSYILLTYENGRVERVDVNSRWTADSDARSILDIDTKSPFITGHLSSSVPLKGKAEGEGMVTAETAFDQLSFTATCPVSVLHTPEYTEKPEYELDIDPSSATLAEGEDIQFTATLTERIYRYMDGEPVGDGPVSVSSTDVTGAAAWSVAAGGECVSPAGKGAFAWASGPGAATVIAEYEGLTASAEIVTLAPAEPDPVPTLTASVTSLDTWGGNTYPLTLVYDDGRGNTTNVTSRASASLSFTGGIPRTMLSWNGSGLVAEDWWGKSGAWVTASPSYTLTLSYLGLSVEISGTMHGYTRAELAPEKPVWHYTEIEDNGWNGPSVIAVLIGSDRTEVWSSDTRVTDSSRILPNGYIGLGTDIPFHARFTDPSNGIIREGNSVFDVQTNVAMLQVSIYVSFAQYGEAVNLVTGTDTGGEFLGSAGIRSIKNGIPAYYINVEQEIWYEDYKGDTHQLTFPDGSVPSRERVSLSGGWSLESRWQDVITENERRTIEITVNGFNASWQWGHIANP